MKVLMLSREYPPEIYGGAGVVVGELSRALARRITVEVRAWGAGERMDGAVRVAGYRGWSELGKGPDGPLFAPALETMSTAMRMVRDPVDADVVHVHTWYADFGGVLAKMLYGIPLVVTLHSMEPLRPWKRDQLGTGYDLSSWIEKTAVEGADRVVAVSKPMRDDVLAHYDVDPERVVVIHNGIDLETYRRSEATDALAKYGVKPPYVLFVGRISEQKGIFHLLEAARKLPAGVQLVLCAAAPDTPELLERMKAGVKGRENVLWIHEMVPKADVIQLYSHARLFVCPSVYEPFGLINLEAMACGTAVLASATGGILEVVEDGRTGILVPPGEVAPLAEAMAALAADPDRAAEMGRAGRARAESKFSWDAVAAETASLYTSLTSM